MLFFFFYVHCYSFVCKSVRCFFFLPITPKKKKLKKNGDCAEVLSSVIPHVIVKFCLSLQLGTFLFSFFFYIYIFYCVGFGCCWFIAMFDVKHKMESSVLRSCKFNSSENGGDGFVSLLSAFMRRKELLFSFQNVESHIDCYVLPIIPYNDLIHERFQ